MSPSLSPPCPWKVRRHLQPRPGGSCGHRQLQASLPPQGSSQHLPTAATFPRRGTPCVLLCSQSHPLCPLVTPPQTRSLREKAGQGNLFSSPNSKIYFNCCNTVDYKQLLCVTEHVQVASWDGWCQRQGHRWAVPCHSQGRGTTAGGTGRRDSRGWLGGAGEPVPMLRST